VTSGRREGRATRSTRASAADWRKVNVIVCFVRAVQFWAVQILLTRLTLSRQRDA
jgi:hypothetical protein